MKLKLIAHPSIYIGLTHQRFAQDWVSDLVKHNWTSKDAEISPASYTCGRGVLCELLRTYGSESESRPVLHTCETGRLILIGSDWYVSISHAKPWTIAAISRVQFGIDIERRDREVDWEAIVETQFPEQIADRILCLPVADRQQAFLREWTLIEASAKLNKGLVLPIIESDIAKSLEFYCTEDLLGCVVTGIYTLPPVRMHLSNERTSDGLCSRAVF